jgi:glutathionyl-hydroquinone reductase
MGFLLSGVWHSDGDPTEVRDRPAAVRTPGFRRWLSAAAHAEFPPEPGRYQLHISLACPWSHYAHLMRQLKRLDALVGLSIVHPVLTDAEGWSFRECAGCIPDRAGAATLAELYVAADPRYTGEVTVPILWDRKRQTIVSNHSGDIMRMLQEAFAGIAVQTPDFYPQPLRAEIDVLNAELERDINEGVYACAMAKSQRAYEAAVQTVFTALDKLEHRLLRRPFLHGDLVTESDWRLFVTLIRFDLVYYPLFRCNRRRIADYPALSRYVRALYEIPGVADTVDFGHIKTGYYSSMRWLNPTGIVPVGPETEFVAQCQPTR